MTVRTGPSIMNSILFPGGIGKIARIPAAVVCALPSAAICDLNHRNRPDPTGAAAPVNVITLENIERGRQARLRYEF